MFRIDDATAAASLPTPEAAGTQGYFTEGNPVGGVPATRVRASWLNRVQELLRAPIVAAGIVPAKTDYDQLRQAIRRLAGGNVSAVSATGALTPDQAGVVTISAASGPVTLTLPAANAAGGAPLYFLLVRTDTTANAVTVQRAGSDLVDGVTSFALPAGGRVGIRSDGAATWRFDSSRAACGRQVFTATGTFTVPPGIFVVKARAWGGGGGGGGAANSGAAGCGGGAGAYREGAFAVTPGQTIAVTIGAGGAGGTSAGGNGGNGGTTSFGALLTAGGGAGGFGSTSGLPAPGGTGGTGSGGSFGFSGQDGTPGSSPGGSFTGGVGGGSFMFGVTTQNIGGGSGQSGFYPGQAGCGAGGGAVVGGSGAAGLLEVEW
jgi:hypothetical protein